MLGALSGNTLFIAKLSATGRWLWAVPFAGSVHRAAGTAFWNESRPRMAVDAAGKVVVCGTYYDTISFGRHTLLPLPLPPTWQPGHGSPDNAFVASLNAAGHWRWALACNPATTTHAKATDITVDAAGHIYLMGHTYNQVAFGGKCSAIISTMTKDGKRCPSVINFIARISPAGRWQWAVPLANQAPTTKCGSNSIVPREIVADHAGNVGVAGLFEDTLTLGPSRLVSTRTLGTPAYPLLSLFVAKLSKEGQWQWAAKASHTVPAYQPYHGSHNIRGDNTAVNALTVGRGNRFYLAGCYEDGFKLTPQQEAGAPDTAACEEGAFVAAVSPRGRWQWIRVAPDRHHPIVGPDRCVSIATDPASGDALVAGYVYGRTAFDSATVIQCPRALRLYVPSPYLAQFSADGTGRWCLDPCAWWGVDTKINAVAAGPKGEIIVAGLIGNRCVVARLNPEFLPATDRRP